MVKFGLSYFRSLEIIILYYDLKFKSKDKPFENVFWEKFNLIHILMPINGQKRIKRGLKLNHVNVVSTTINISVNSIYLELLFSIK